MVPAVQKCLMNQTLTQVEPNVNQVLNAKTVPPTRGQVKNTLTLRE